MSDAFLQHCEQQINGLIGAVVSDQHGNMVLSHRADHVFPSASLIKVPLAWQWLHGDTSDTHRLTAAQICDPDGSLAALAGLRLPQLEIARVMITESENNATNLVLDWIGGIDAANHWLKQRGWHTTRWKRRMLDWQARARGAENTTTARSCAQILWHLQRSAGWPARMLRQWMRDSVHKAKLECGLSEGMVLAHKVGDLPTIEHDIGIITKADGSWFVISVLVQGQADATALCRVHGALLKNITNAGTSSGSSVKKIY